MDLYEAMLKRHTVRKFSDKQLSFDVVQALLDRMNLDNARYGVNMLLRVDDAAAFGAISKLFLAKNVQNYLILGVRPDAPVPTKERFWEETKHAQEQLNADTRAAHHGYVQGAAAIPGADNTTVPPLTTSSDGRERLGYAGADMMLFAQTLGLNSWWVGATYNRKAVAQQACDRQIVGVIALGYGITEGEPHKSKALEEISSYDAIESPAWFRHGVETALLAPTALNKQAFTITGRENKVLITYAPGTYASEDLGLVKFHFAAGAGPHHFEWA